MEKDVVKLKGIEVYEIALQDKGNDYGEKTKLAGEKFRRYRYNGVVFTVKERDPFNEAFDKGELASVKLLQGTRMATTTNPETGESEEHEVATVDFDSFMTCAQEKGYKKHQASLSRIEKIATSVDLSDENVDKLLNAVV